MGCRCIDATKHSWAHKRYSWRFSWLYKRIAIVLFILVTLCFVFYALGTSISCDGYTSCGYFANYECSRESLLFIMYAVLTQNWVWFAYGTIQLLLALLVRTFTDYKMKDFMNAGRFGDFLGCAVKYLPWVATILYTCWLFLAIVSLILVAAFSICSNRFNSLGIAAVKNCRWYYTVNSDSNKPEECGSGVSTQVAKAEIWSCNSITNLKSKRFAALDCEINVSLHICEVYNDFSMSTGAMNLVDAYNSLDVATICQSERPAVYIPIDEHSASEEAHGRIPDYYWHEINSLSDMYRYALLWALVSAFFIAAVTVLALMVRMHSPVESSFYTPAESGDFCLTHCLKQTSPWNGQ